MKTQRLSHQHGQEDVSGKLSEMHRAGVGLLKTLTAKEDDDDDDDVSFKCSGLCLGWQGLH